MCLIYKKKKKQRLVGYLKLDGAVSKIIVTYIGIPVILCISWFLILLCIKFVRNTRTEFIKERL